MAAISLALTGSSIDETGQVTVNYSDSSSITTSLENLQQEATEFDQDDALAKKILRVKLLTAEPVLNDPHALDGISVSINRFAAQPIVVEMP